MSIFSRILEEILSWLEGPMTPEALNAALERQAQATPERLDWRNSIVDLMKLTGQDSSLHAREQLAQELGYTGELNGSAEMNTFLYKEVMKKLAAN